MTTNDIKHKIWSILMSVVSKWQIKRLTWFDKIASKLLKAKFHYKCKFEVAIIKSFQLIVFNLKEGQYFCWCSISLNNYIQNSFLIISFSNDVARSQKCSFTNFSKNNFRKTFIIYKMIS